MVLSSWFYDELIKFWCVFNILQLLFKTFSFRHEEIDDLMSFWWISLEVPTRLQTCMPKPSLLLGSGWSILNLFISAICHLPFSWPGFMVLLMHLHPKWFRFPHWEHVSRKAGHLGVHGWCLGWLLQSVHCCRLSEVKFTCSSSLRVGVVSWWTNFSVPETRHFQCSPPENWQTPWSKQYLRRNYEWHIEKSIHWVLNEL